MLRSAADLAAATELIRNVTGAAPQVDGDTRRVGAPVRDRIHALTQTVRHLDDAVIVVEDVTLRRPTLDEVFLHLTGRVRRIDDQGGGGVSDPLTPTATRLQRCCETPGPSLGAISSTGHYRPPFPLPALFGNPGLAGGSWAAEHAVALAVAWPVLLIAVFLPLAARRFRRLSY